jgi:transposase InsO family protein
MKRAVPQAGLAMSLRFHLAGSARDGVSWFVARVGQPLAWKAPNRIREGAQGGTVRRSQPSGRYGTPEGAEGGAYLARGRPAAHRGEGAERPLDHVSLGIKLHRSRPASPQDNGGHERMHRDLDELRLSPARSQRAQQPLCAKWALDFNHVRPHEALANKTPAEVYGRPPPRLPAVRVPTYPAGYLTRRVLSSGRERSGHHRDRWTRPCRHRVRRACQQCIAPQRGSQLATPRSPASPRVRRSYTPTCHNGSADHKKRGSLAPVLRAASG